MKIKINLNKKQAIPIIAILILLAGAIAVIAYGTSSPSVFGHTGDEIANISITPIVPLSIITGYNNEVTPACAPNSNDDPTKFAIPGAISACNRYCSSGCTGPAAFNCAGGLSGLGYKTGTFVECNTTSITCLCIN